MRKLYVLVIIICCLALQAMAQTNITYVDIESRGAGDGSSWDNATTIAAALDAASANTEIWMRGYDDLTTVYTVPASGYTLRSGVRLYGGFSGKETSADQREISDGKAYRMRYRTVLSADINNNDVIDATNLIFPGNTSRTADNATRVLTLDMTPSQLSGNNNGYATVVNGLTIASGHADGTGEYGGGILVTGNNAGGGVYRIEQCFFTENYATQGGALYVGGSVANVNNNECLIDRCGFFNNAADGRIGNVNAGGAIYLGGAGTVVNCAVFNNENGGVYIATTTARIVNSTVTRNTGSGVDGKDCPVVNTAVWGNAFLTTSNDTRPDFSHCAYPEASPGATDTDGNVYLAAKNNDANGPHFSSPSIKTGYDTDFSLRQSAYPLWTWDPTEATPLVDAGDDAAYSTTLYGASDLNGAARVSGTAIDIGAFEYQPISASRIRYVKPDGTGDGTSWNNASGDIQRMIDNLAENNPYNQPGEVWIAAGIYEPQTQLITGTSYSASFRMRDGISVYGGFNGTETAKGQREKGAMPWEYDNKTVLMAAYYTEGDLDLNNNRWSLTSDSRHVVWFAPMSGEETFSRITYLDGVTVKGGYAQGDTGLDDFMTDRGAGVYIDGENAYLTNCIVTENNATGNGGGVYLKGGRVISSLVYNNNSNANGGAVYVDDSGLVLRSMLANNSARNGAGAYLDNNDAAKDHPEYLILSTCVVSNNTVSGNGAVYCGAGGVLLQNTITNNTCITATDATDPNASQTGGIYIDEYALVANSVVWNNHMGASSNTTNIPMYARNPTAAKVRFLYNAISGVNNAIWNNVLQQQTLSLVDANAGIPDDHNSIGPRFAHGTSGQMTIDYELETNVGIQQNWKDNSAGIKYYWKPIDGSNLWARGMAIGQLPDEVVIAPEIDIEGSLFEQKPAVGAFHVKGTTIVPALEKKQNSTNYTLIIYVDPDCTEPEHNGSSWKNAYRSLNDAIRYFSELESGNVTAVQNGNDVTLPLSYVEDFEIRVLECDLWPHYAFVNEDYKTATIDILAMKSGKPLRLSGGYHRNNGDSNNVVRDPLAYRSQLNGSNDGATLADGIYHVVTVEAGAKDIVLDGFHIVNGYAASSATLQYGAGMLVYDGASVTLDNCIFENNTAVSGAAIDARNAKLVMNNCVVNNNTNTTSSNSVINCRDLTLNHVTIVNNDGAAPQDIGATSFAAGNTDGNTIGIATTSTAGALHFANPTNNAGATLGFDTYLGGYSSFRPLTSSEEAGNNIINKVSASSTSTLTTDITGNARDLGGAPDLGAYEAELPVSGDVLYVRGTDGDDSNDGLSWGKAFKTLTKALEVAKTSNETVKEIWVAKGEYTNQSESTDLIHSQRYAFYFVEGVNVYGGFASEGTPGFNDRNPKSNETILRTIESNPTSIIGQVSTGRVLVQKSNFTTETVYDGFTLCNGYLFSCYRQDILGYITSVDKDKIGLTGGAGVYLMKNGIIENCIVKDNLVYVDPSEAGGLMTQTYTTQTPAGGYHQAAAGVFNSGGVIRNSTISGNKLVHKLYNASGIVQSAWMYGAGLFMYEGTVYNTIISQNESYLSENNIETGYHEVMVGTGAFLVNGKFYNNTIVGNKSTTGKTSQRNITVSGVYVTNNMEMYNSIIADNSETNGGSNSSGMTINGYSIASFRDGSYIPAPENVKVKYSCIELLDENKNLATTNDEGTNKYEDPQFVDADDHDYHLQSGSPAINSGTENITGVTIPGYDADYTDRIKDCAIDMGAFESENEDNISGEETGDKIVYYVTQNGAGTRSGASLGNAACADKLQQVLNAAGQKVATNTTPVKEVIVKLAGYAVDEESGEPDFTYSVNTLASTSDPQSYTYVVPEGVTLMGGYNEQAADWNEETAGTDGEEKRDAMTYRTVLSAIAQPHTGSTITQEVNGYHTVTFGAWPGTAALTKPTVIDGVWLTDGSATSMAGAGNPATRGGGAIVPKGAHVRNCMVTGCEAVDGGGLYVMPGATVSGTAVIGNTADNGGGIYADNTGAGADSRAHIISCTITDNTAGDGGGLYLEDGAAMTVNSVIWGNTAQSNRNVSGVTGERFADDKLAGIYNISPGYTSFYPFNNCFVESQEMPSDYENTSMESDNSGDGSMYFADSYRRLKELSPLIKHGVADGYYYSEDNTDKKTFVSEFGVATSDMCGVARVQANIGADRIDAGAFAYDGGILPEELFTRIFVSQTHNVRLTEEGADMLDYLGRSFYTSFSTLEDALAYVRYMRKEKSEAAGKQFEILIAGGTYKPSSAVVNDGATHNQRLFSFVVPYGVSIYGGFKGTENYLTPQDMQYGNNKVTSIPSSELTGTMDNTSSLESIIGLRTFSDFNGNGIKEAWELAEQTILSGNVNVSSDAENVHNVVYTEAEADEENMPVTIDGVTVMGGETLNLSDDGAADNAGRGGGLYSDGVSYTISRCRFIDNTARQGGAVYVRDARLDIIGSIFAGNGAVDGGSELIQGGAVFLSSQSSQSSAASLYSVNSLYVNNETTGKGGVIAMDNATGLETTVNLMNCTFAKNKAGSYGVIYGEGAKSVITNTLMWGNETTTEDATTTDNRPTVTYSASDVDYYGAFSADDANNKNILLDKNNTSTNGPRFTNPATKAGVDGNASTNLWNPSSISVVTDKGDGVISVNDTEQGAYKNWFGAVGLSAYQSDYMGSTDYYRYSGPLKEDGSQGNKPIDIGAYEYQYYSNFSTMPAIYVAPEQSGDGSGNSWANATSDLRGAIIGAANPTQEKAERVVYVMNGDYSLQRLSGGTAFTVNMSSSDLSKSLTIKGACTGSGDQQDFNSQSILRSAESVSTPRLMSVNANSKTVTIEGFTFINKTGETGEIGNGVDANTDSGSITFKNNAFRRNSGIGLKVSGSGKALVYNTLFADGGTGLSGNANTTVVNATFANNTTDLENNTPAVYNSVSWNNENSNMNETEGNNNKVFDLSGTTAADNNSDVLNGPNFVDPLNADKEQRNYHIRPSLALLNKGDSKHYSRKVLGGEDKSITDSDERDLGNNPRLIDTDIDIGAYEYEALLRPIIYVMAGLTASNLDGTSWEKAIGDLQGAVDLAGIYTKDSGNNAYVFVHNNMPQADLRITLPNIKVYGGMNYETSEYTENGYVDVDNVKAIVKDLLSQRSGLIERTNHSKLGNVTISTEGTVVDGFEVNGKPTIGSGVLSTSIVKGDVASGGGILYNSLVYGDVSGIKTVNVTATGTISDFGGNANNRPKATADNKYVTANEWAYQLNETSADIDVADASGKATEACIGLVGHDRDIAGNKRIRNTVDNGCFETWNITPGMTADNTVTNDDYPHGQSVVYVRKADGANPSAELGMDEGLTVYTEAAPFNPGVLLLEHQAGLRGNGNHIGLSYVIMERDVAAGATDMAYAPFGVTSVENNGGVALDYYDGAVRATYDYAFDGSNSTAWKTALVPYGNTGLLLDNTAGTAAATVRFIGQGSNVYTENSGVKSVELKKYNFNEPWTSSNNTGNKFTHKENMSWNLFGSPYLCAMNYGDMEYGRVVYAGGTYTAIATYDTDAGTAIKGYIPAGDAVFTQTATLKERETFKVEHGAERLGTAYATSANTLAVSLSRTADTRAATDDAAADMVMLNAVAAEMSRSDFDMGADGVKWMAGGKPLIYATMGNGRYSLLSAVNIEGEVGIGVSVPEAGMYTIAVPYGCDASQYESVVLKDAVTGKATNLLDNGYDFTAISAGDTDGRFTITFNRMIADNLAGGIRAYSPNRGVIRVEGLATGDRVTVYSADGMAVSSSIAASSTADLEAPASSVAIVKVERDGKRVATVKTLLAV